MIFCVSHDGVAVYTQTHLAAAYSNDNNKVHLQWAWQPAAFISG